MRPIRFFVMAGLVPAIHVFLAATLVKSWMPGTSPGMTSFGIPADLLAAFLSQTLRSQTIITTRDEIDKSAIA